MSGWISVKDRLPEDEDYYLVAWRRGTNSVVLCSWWYDKESRKDRLLAGNFCPRTGFARSLLGRSHTDGKRVTHWMPMPESPEDGE